MFGLSGAFALKLAHPGSRVGPAVAESLMAGLAAMRRMKQSKTELVLGKYGQTSSCKK
jgi:hypothetical protein